MSITTTDPMPYVPQPQQARTSQEDTVSPLPTSPIHEHGPVASNAPSTSRSNSRQRLANSLKAVFGSHGHDLNFADEKGLERKSRDASRSASRAASRDASRSNSRANSPSRGRDSQTLGQKLFSHGHELNFADEKGLERKSRDASRSASRNASRANSPSRGRSGAASPSNAAHSSSLAQKLFSHSHELNFANEKGLERKSRDASRSASANGSANNSRSNSRVRPQQ